MSNLLHDGNDHDYPAAAYKHLLDAQALLTADRFDGAGYVVGYVVECSLLTVILVGAIARELGVPRAHLGRALAPGTLRRRDHRVGYNAARAASRDHQLDDLADAVATYTTELNAGNARYAPPVDKTTPLVGGWTYKLRYEGEGKVDKNVATAWVAEAEALFNATVGEMIRDGVVQL